MHLVWWTFRDAFQERISNKYPEGVIVDIVKVEDDYSTISDQISFLQNKAVLARKLMRA